jgi:UDP-N-acetylmuramoylalanine--D-glutamate ligase
MNYDSLELAGKHILVLGLGETGLSAARWLAARGAHLAVADSRSEPPNVQRLRELLPEVVLHTGAFDAALLMSVEMLVASPGVALAEPAIARAMAAGVEIVGDVELFARALAALNRDRAHPMKCIAITGSNGKSTVTAMCGELCRRAGLETCVAGNIGLPVLEALLETETGNAPAPDVWVLELSSFQLETTASLAADAATVLNVSEDHMDRYADLAAYAAAKARIFNGSGTQVLNRDDAMSLAMALPNRPVVHFGLDSPGDGDFGICDDELCHDGAQLMPLAELPLTGLHNVANALAALALTIAIGCEIAPLLQGLLHFQGLPHRVERVAEIDGVTYYDDSKGTNVGATEAALYGMGKRRAVVILGGDGKGQDFTPLKAAVVANARAVILIGRAAGLIRAALGDVALPIESAATLEAAVVAARRLAQPGDAVLLSPACASFDMFRNYTHRAEVFVAAVHRLAEDTTPPSPQPSPACGGGGERARGAPRAG